MTLSRWSINKPVPAVLLFVLLTIGGLLAFQSLAVQSFPDMDLPVITVAARLEGASPAQLETEVARKIEDRLVSLGHIDHINTMITDGSVAINAIFSIEKNPEVALNEVRNAVEDSRSDLPAEMSAPAVSRSTTQTSALLTFVVQASTLDEKELSWFIDNDLRKVLLSVKGVGEVERIGGVNREIHVDLDTDAMAALGVSATDVSSSLRAVQVNLSGGQGEVGQNRQGIRTLGKVASVSELAALSVPLPKNGWIRLDQVARVSDTSDTRTSLAFRDGKPVIAVQIKRRNGYSDLGVARDARERLKVFQTGHPEVAISEASNTVAPIVDEYDSSMHMLYEGALIAMFVIWLFLRDCRSTFLAGTVLPLSIIPSFMVMKVAGFSLNCISLLALSLVVGILLMTRWSRLRTSHGTCGWARNRCKRRRMPLTRSGWLLSRLR
jgi:multidrug efflux pump subunit AcrB